MKIFLSIVSLLSLLVLSSLFSTGSFASENKPEEKNQIKKTGKSTEVNFEDLLVQGKYHFSDEAVVTVEQDKVLDALLGVRTEFKDRIEQSTTRF